MPGQIHIAPRMMLPLSCNSFIYVFQTRTNLFANGPVVMIAVNLHFSSKFMAKEMFVLL